MIDQSVLDLTVKFLNDQLTYSILHAMAPSSNFFLEVLVNISWQYFLRGVMKKHFFYSQLGIKGRNEGD